MERFLRPLTFLLFIAASFCGCALAGADEQAFKAGQSFKDCVPDCPEMIVVPAGSFAMGSLQAEPGRQLTEAPQHEVAITKPFAVSKFEVTFAE
jgi:formylglycine-generating enzyme required for sulfatase activity